MGILDLGAMMQAYTSQVDRERQAKIASGAPDDDQKSLLMQGRDAMREQAGRQGTALGKLLLAMKGKFGGIGSRIEAAASTARATDPPVLPGSYADYDRHPETGKIVHYRELEPHQMSEEMRSRLLRLGKLRTRSGQKVQSGSFADLERVKERLAQEAFDRAEHAPVRDEGFAREADAMIDRGERSSFANRYSNEEELARHAKRTQALNTLARMSASRSGGFHLDPDEPEGERDMTPGEDAAYRRKTLMAARRRIRETQKRGQKATAEDDQLRMIDSLRKKWKGEGRSGY